MLNGFEIYVRNDPREREMRTWARWALYFGGALLLFVAGYAYHWAQVFEAVE